MLSFNTTNAGVVTEEQPYEVTEIDRKSKVSSYSDNQDNNQNSQNGQYNDIGDVSQYDNRESETNYMPISAVHPTPMGEPRYIANTHELHEISDSHPNMHVPAYSQTVYNNYGYGEYSTPSDHNPLGSMVSIQSSSSVQPILPAEDSNSGTSLFKMSRRKLLILIVAILAVLLTIIIVAAAVMSSGDNGNIPQGSDESAPVNTTTTLTTLTTTLSTPRQTTTPLLTTTPQITTPQIITSTTTPPNPPISPLVIFQHPKDTAAVIGDQVTLCCKAVGSPGPQSYDWYKDGVLLNGDFNVALINTQSVLTLTTVTLNSAGHYSCKATNDEGFINSVEAYLEVRESNTYCESTPWSWPTALPLGCTHNGQVTIDRGYCPTRLCSGGGMAGCITDGQRYCCGPVTLSTQEIVCDDVTMNVTTVTECGCVRCDQPYYDITGIIQSVDGETPFANAHLYFYELSEDFTSYSNDRADTSGNFHITIYNNTRRLHLVTDNTYDRQSFYSWSSHIIHLPELISGPVHISADMRFMQETRTSFHSTNDVTLSVTFTDGSQFINTVTIPSNQYYFQNGSQFTGSFDLSVDAIKGDDFEKLRAAPGDFVHIGADGKEYYLITYGIFAMEMRIGSENTLDQISYDGNITITIDPNVIMGEADNTVLWRLGENGFWHKEDELYSHMGRRKRSTVVSYEAVIKGIDKGYAWFAIAMTNTYDICHTKLAVLARSDNTDPGSFISGAQVEILIKNSLIHAGSIFTKHADLDVPDEYGYCIEHPCHESLSGEIIVTYDNQRLLTTTGNEKYLFTPQFSENGPSYLANMSSECSFQNHEVGNSIVFEKQTCSRKFNYVEYPKSLTFDRSECDMSYYQGWHSPQEYVSYDFTACHIKIISNSASSNTVFRALSYVGDLSELGGDFASGQNLLYGIHDHCTVSVGGYEVACLEIKTGGKRNCNGNLANQVIDAKTTVEIHSVTSNLTVMDLDSSLRRKVEVEREDTRLHLKIPSLSYGRIYGIYCHSDKSPESARSKSEKKCLSGLDDASYASGVNRNYYAVKFN